jgi:branched-chain amino acid transport system ATP-binding protein
MLKVDRLNISYGRLQAVWDVSFEVSEHEFVTILGPNGAGKTTLLKTISGLINPTSGVIEFQNERLNGLSPHKICGRRIIHIPEGRKIFPGMTVKENLEMGASLPGPRKNSARSLAEVYDLFPILKERQNQLAGTFSGGQQQQLAIGRGLMGQPKLLMLDEPTLGLSPKLVTEAIHTLKLLNDSEITILLVSQEVLQSLQITERAYVLENGKITLSGTGEDLLENMDIKKSYLGL